MRRIALLFLANCGAFPQPAHNNTDASTADAKADASGDAMPDTSSAALTVTATTPVSNSTGNTVPATAITATFSANLDCTKVTNSSIQVLETSTTTAVAGQVSCAQATLTFVPTVGLLTNTMLTATIDQAVSSSGGGTLGSPYSWTFTMAAWTRQFGTTGNDDAKTAFVDSAGNIYVGGFTTGNLDSNTNAGGTDLYITKYRPDASRAWTKLLGTGVDELVFGIAGDGSGNTTLVGDTFGAIDGNVSSGGVDMFIVKYDTNGVKQWTRQLGSSAGDWAVAIANDTAGNVYAVGYTAGGIDGNTNAGLNDLVVGKYDGNGNKQWVRQLGTSADDLALGAAVDTNGDVYVTGATAGGLDGNTSAGMNDLFLVKYDASGAKQWTRQLGTSGAELALGAAADGTGIYVTGYTNGALDGMANAGSNDIFLVKYNAAGTKQWTHLAGSSSGEQGNSVTANPNGIYIAGECSAAFDGTLNAGGPDGCVIKYDANGTKQWTRQFGSAGSERAYDSALASDGSLYVVGTTTGGLDGNVFVGGDDSFVVKYQQDGRKR